MALETVNSPFVLKLAYTLPFGANTCNTPACVIPIVVTPILHMLKLVVLLRQLVDRAPVLTDAGEHATHVISPACDIEADAVDTLKTFTPRLPFTLSDPPFTLTHPQIA